MRVDVREAPCPFERRATLSGPNVIVVDASVLAVALIDDASNGGAARERLRGEQLAAPELIDLEIASVWRGLARAGIVNPHRVDLALADLSEMPLQRAPHSPLLRRCWELRDNLTIYDAAYVALAEALQCPLVTADQRLAKANCSRCTIEVLDVDS